MERPRNGDSSSFAIPSRSRARRVGQRRVGDDDPVVNARRATSSSKTTNVSERSGRRLSSKFAARWPATHFRCVRRAGASSPKLRRTPSWFPAERARRRKKKTVAREAPRPSGEYLSVWGARRHGGLGTKARLPVSELKEIRRDSVSPEIWAGAFRTRGPDPARELITSRRCRRRVTRRPIRHSPA